MSDRAHTLTRLSDTDKVVANPDRDIRGRTVVDRNGDDLGKIHDLLIDTGEEKIRFLRVQHGGILGIGASESFIPVDAVREVTEDRVHVDLASEQVAGAPRYDPELIDQSDYYSDMYHYYGYAPYWTPGYIYPAGMYRI
ncbi:PRC-barrel domain-containing protein [Catenuloplanes indicus]|uniref:Sporulation protein YlmC with PRC-barrel domain n=1 Tax=Catenuloplanes indicus TaxID=137267 RepID=A0AAE3VY65_9ACTN|nr:PRC-barrel domain-containing protein [Catenuloplanes indicus]MDQ0365155.1 sporulation protein YlmC with PRC-barrel domain [Catenuloplanes indicus]